MNKDIRINIAFLDHPKTLKLQKRIGAEGVFCLMRFWSFVALNKPNGKLIDMDIEDIELAARWNGQEGLFVQTLIELRWLDKGDDGLLSVHDWEEHNGYASHAGERSEMARKAVNTRWAKLKQQKDTETTQRNTDVIQDVYAPYTQRNTDVIQTLASSNTPSPSPTPTPSPVLTNTHTCATDVAREGGLVAASVEVYKGETQHTETSSLTETKSAKKPKPAKNQVFDNPDFEHFWLAYPKKRSKGDAQKAWLKLNPSKQLTDVILHAVEQAKTSEQWLKDGGQYIPYPATWLNAEGWNDENTVSVSRSEKKLQKGEIDYSKWEKEYGS